ncbi:MAG: hypothetical protein K8R23_17825 [Chthoniobacter sp.]|nr:hypothetical protein [Chthoniobacter sp.]
MHFLAQQNVRDLFVVIGGGFILFALAVRDQRRAKGFRIVGAISLLFAVLGIALFRFQSA